MEEGEIPEWANGPILGILDGHRIGGFLGLFLFIFEAFFGPMASSSRCKLFWNWLLLLIVCFILSVCL